MNAQSPMTGKQALLILIDTINDEGNAFSIEDRCWGDLEEDGFKTRFPDDSFQGRCGTPACILGWSDYLDETVDGYETSNLYIPDVASLPNASDKTTDGHDYQSHTEWFTRARTVAMLEHVYATFDEAIGWGETNWQALEELGQ